MIKHSKYKLRIFIGFIFFLFTCLVLYSSDHIFFWDTVQLSSKQAHWFYENDFKYLLLPNNIDSGHIPFFGIYLASVWKIFGKTLWVSHLAMLPFVIGIVWQAYMLVQRFITPKYLIPALFIFLADPTLLGQSILVSPDIMLVFFYLTGLNAVISNNRWLIMLAVLGLFLTSMRGMIISIAILTVDIYQNDQFTYFKQSLLNITKMNLAYIPALAIFFIYSLYHLQAKEWLGFHQDSPWKTCFQTAGWSGIMKNIIIIAWRFFDFGRIFLWSITIVLIVKTWKNLLKDKNIRLLVIIFLSSLLSLFFFTVWFSRLTAHRYYLPVYLSFALLASYVLLNKIEATKTKNILNTIIITSLITGNLWIYPEKISQGWDASLAHIPYYQVRKDMMHYLKKNNIELHEVGCVFPNKAELKYLDLSESSDAFASKNFKKNQYILYSNIYNDYIDKEIDKLKNNWQLVKRFQKYRIFLSLYKHPE